MMLSSSIHFPANDRISVFFMAEQYSMVCMYTHPPPYFLYPFGHVADGSLAVVAELQ
jgi:hypothetical protein